MEVHVIKTLPEYFGAVDAGVKTFEIRKNDRAYQVKDFLKLQEFDGKNYTGQELLREITYMTNYEQKEGYVVLAIADVPKSLVKYLALSEREKSVFKSAITHMHLYGLSERDVANTIWEIIVFLIGDVDLFETDQQWYMEYWDEG